MILYLFCNSLSSGLVPGIVLTNFSHVKQSYNLNVNSFEPCSIVIEAAYFSQHADTLSNGIY